MATLIGWLEHVGLYAIFVLVLIEQIGLPLPSYPLLIVAGAWSVHGGATPGRIVLVAIIACLLADGGWYVAGYRLGSRVLRSMCRLSLVPDSCISDTEHLFARFGTRLLVVAKFVPALGAVATAMSGVVGASVLSFTAFDLVGSALWAGSGVAIGVVFHDAVGDVLDDLAGFGRLGLVGLAIALAAFVAYKLWRRHLFFRELKMSRISVFDLMELMQMDPEPTVVDARSAASRDRDGMIPGAIALEELGPRHAAVVGHGEVIVYCACPNEATAARVAARLKALGFSRVRPLEGGIHAWEDAGFNLARISD